MTTYTRSISRITVSAAPLPAWRQGMVPNKLYQLGQDPMTSAYFTYPHNGGTINPPSGLYGSSPVRAGEFPYGWGGSAFVPELSTFGKLLFTGTGENVLGEQWASLDLSEDSPIYRVHTEPGYCTSLAQAQAEDADLFYDENYMTANYSAGYRSTHMCLLGQDEAAFVQQWDGQFPITRFTGWVFWRKIKGNMLKGRRPHMGRYELNVSVPASVMGNGAPGMFVNTRAGIKGPWYYSENPAASSFTTYKPFSAYYENVYANGYPKTYIKWQNASSGAWTILGELPQAGSANTAGPLGVVGIYDAATKRVYYTNPDGALIYVDLSTGIANASIVGPVSVTDAFGGSTSRSLYGNHCITNGHPTKRLWFMRESVVSGALVMYDLATNTRYSLRGITGMPNSGSDTSPTGFWGFSYDAANNRVLITVNNNAGISSYYFTIPSAHTNPAAYTCVNVPINQNGVTPDQIGNPTFIWQHGERSTLIPTLGVIVTTQYRGRPLVYLPG